MGGAAVEAAQEVKMIGIWMLVGCVAGSGDTGALEDGGTDPLSYPLAGIPWTCTADEGTVPTVSAQCGEWVTLTAAGVVLVDGTDAGTWDGPWPSDEASQWAYGAIEIDVNGAPWTMVPRGEPDVYRWYLPEYGVHLHTNNTAG